MKITCKECGDVFEITPEEEVWYKSKGFELPKRCKSCRDLRRRNIIVKEDVNYVKKKN